MCLCPLGCSLDRGKWSNDGLGGRICRTPEDDCAHASNVSYAAAIADAQNVPQSTGTVPRNGISGRMEEQPCDANWFVLQRSVALVNMGIVNDFPDFMKDSANHVPKDQQHTEAVEGYVFDGSGVGQMAFWSCAEDMESEWHTHDFDEYFVVVAGEYLLLLEGSERVLRPGDEVVVPSGVRQAARVAAGTRTIHAFGGQRVVKQ